MSYKVETAKIVPGGLNLLAPGDQIQDGDCLDLQGFWPGSAGRVEVAPAPVVLSGATNIDSVCAAGSTIYSGNSVTGTLYKNGASIDTGYDAKPLGMISYQGYLWVINQAVGKQKKYDGTTLSDWTPAAPAAPTLTDGGVDGSGLTPVSNNPPLVGFLRNVPYKYYYTWMSPAGESNPSPAATITPAVNGSIVRITRGVAPAGATGWVIYREVEGTAYRLIEDTALDFNDTRYPGWYDDYGDEQHTQSDTILLQMGVIMEADHDAAPQARIMANQVFNGRILVANSAAHPNRIWYTQALQPGFFRGAANPFDGDWVDVGTDSGDDILGMSVRPNLVIIYRAKSIWRHVGDFGDADARLEPLVPEIGIVGPHAFCSTSVGDFFRGPEAVYRLTDWAQPVSGKVETLFRAGGALPENFAREDDPTKCALGYENGRLWVSYKEAVFQVGLIYHVASDRWFRTYYGFNCFAPGDGELLGGLTGVARVRYGTAYNNIAFQSAYLDGNLPDHEKTWADLVINHNTGGVDLTVTIRVNKKRDATYDEFVVATLNSSAMTKQIVPLVYPAGYPTVALRGLPIRAYNLSVRISGSTVPAGSSLDSPILVHYYLEARKAKAFDTDETDHGIQGVKEIDQVELDIDTSDGTSNMLPYSDIPGGTMAARALEGVIQTTGRQSVRLVLTAPIDGKLLRYTLYTSTTLQLYGMRARVLPIGVYLTGEAGEFWQPQPQSVGV